MNILPLQRDSDVAVKYARFFRASYESYSYRKGEPESWRKFEGQVAFREGDSIVYKTMR